MRSDEPAAFAERNEHGQRPQPGATSLRTDGSLVSVVVAAIAGIAPHVLHHAGPLAGSALLAGAAGTTLFGIVGFVVSSPTLLSLRRRFRSWLAPAFATAFFALVYLFSTLIVGPAIARA